MYHHLFFFSSRRRHTRWPRDWSSDVCSSDLNPILMIVALLLVILAPLAAQFVQLAVSRNREYLADATAVELTRNPVGLINALRKISGDPHDVKRANSTTASMYIDMPLKKERRKRASLLSTHPPIESRIERLEDM